MNKQIVRLTYVALVLVGVLVVMTTYWQTWAAASLADRQDNAIKRVAEFAIDRGLIFSFEPRKRLARNIEREIDGKTLFFRRYPYGSLAAHVVGYSTVGRSRTGLERSLNDYLTASNANLSTLVDKALDEFHGKPVQGNNVVTNLDLDAQAVALEELGTQCGAVVALDPRTGKVKVMASTPGFDPNLVEESYEAISRITADCTPAAPLLNRGSAGLFVPGSIFKVITASAALESRRYGPEAPFVDPGYCTVYGKRVNNFDTTWPYGAIDLTNALASSVNSVFCKIGLKLDSIEQYLDYVFKSKNGKQEYEVFVEQITTHKTFFFRENYQFEFLKRILPDYQKAHGNRVVNIWSAGCSTGEEVYTLGIVMHEKKQDIPLLDYKITGTDISIPSLNKAARGLFSMSELENMPEGTQSKYFNTQIYNGEPILHFANAEIKSKINLGEYILQNFFHALRTIEESRDHSRDPSPESAHPQSPPGSTPARRRSSRRPTSG
jgi:hypothetical protein